MVATKFQRQRSNKIRVVCGEKSKKEANNEKNQDPRTIITRYGLSRNCLPAPVDKNVETPGQRRENVG